ncbi:MAG TPA: TadE family protein [Chloroflexota bacterium]
MIEFAFIATVLLLLFLGTTDYARFLYYDTGMRNVARVAAETAINRCLSNAVCNTSSQPASNDEILWSVYCEARPYDKFKPSYGVSGTSGTVGALVATPTTKIPEPALAGGAVHTFARVPPGGRALPAVVRRPALAATAAPAPTATPLPGPGSSVCFAPPGQTVTLGGSAYAGDTCATGCATSGANAQGQNCAYDVCVSPATGRTSGTVVTVSVGYRFQPITLLISQFFHDQSCFAGDDPAINHHNLCFSSTATVSQ